MNEESKKAFLAGVQAAREGMLNVEKSTHKVEVVRVEELLRHENADSLSKVKVWEYTCCVRTADWKAGDLAAFIPPDSVVDVSLPQFAFLAKKAKDGKARIRTEKLRGVVSYGLLVHAPEGAKIGEDVAGILKVEHWEPDLNISITGGEAAKPPSGHFPVYDVDAFMKYGKEVFVPGEPVVVTEKIHGANSRYVFKNDQMYYGSRTEWKKEYPSKPNITLDDLIKQFNDDEEKAKKAYKKIENWKPSKNLWWRVAENTPAVEVFCRGNPNYTLYGEAYGFVKGFPYGTKTAKFVAFDILTPDETWLDFVEFRKICKKYEIPVVPVIHESVPFDFDQLVKMAEGKSNLDDHIREGVVVRPVKERWDERLGRVQLKIINPEY